MKSINHAEFIPYGILVNQVPIKRLEKYKNNQEFIEKINQKLKTKTKYFGFLPLVEDAFDKDDVLLELPELIDFINLVPLVQIKKENVNDIEYD